MKENYIKFSVWLKSKLGETFEGMKNDERGLATVEYAIVTVAAAGFAAVLIFILKSDWARDALQNMIGGAFEEAGVNAGS